MLGQVLVVDRYAPRLQLIRDALEVAGFSVLAAEDGMECLLKLKVERPDLVVLDTTVPAMRAEQVLQTMRQRAETRNLPVILLTSQARPHDPLGAPGGNGVVSLARPVKLATLVAAAMSMLPGPGRRPG